MAVRLPHVWMDAGGRHGAGQAPPPTMKFYIDDLPVRSPSRRPLPPLTDPAHTDHLPL